MQSAAMSSASQTLSELRPLVENLLLLLSEKEKVVVTKRFDLDGTRHFTLEEIGHDFSVTRERIRQIEKSALDKMKRNVFNSSLKNLHEYVTELVRSHGGIFRADSLYVKLESLAGELNEFDRNCAHLALVLHEDLSYVGNTIDYFPHVREHSVVDYSLKHVSNKIINQLHKHGDVENLEKLKRNLASDFSDSEFSIARTKSLIDIDKRLTLLESDMVGLLEWRHIHPRTLRDKILFILRNEKKPLHFGYIADSISSANFDNKRVNVQAVHNELIRHDQFVLVGRGIYALAEWGYEKGTVADVIKSILSEHGELEQDEIVDKVLDKRQVKKITIVLALKNSASFERIGRKRYKLVN